MKTGLSHSPLQIIYPSLCLHIYTVISTKIGIKGHEEFGSVGFITEMTNEVVPTKGIRAAQAPCECKDKQHMQMLECMFLCECFSSPFWSSSKGIIFFLLSWLQRKVEFSTVWVWPSCYSMFTHIIAGHMVSAVKLGRTFGIGPFCLVLGKCQHQPGVTGHPFSRSVWTTTMDLCCWRGQQ